MLAAQHLIVDSIPLFVPYLPVVGRLRLAVAVLSEPLAQRGLAQQAQHGCRIALDVVRYQRILAVGDVDPFSAQGGGHHGRALGADQRGELFRGAGQHLAAGVGLARGQLDPRVVVNQLQQIYDAEAPLVPLFTGPEWGAYSDARFTGWPSESNPYATLSTRGATTTLVLTSLVPAP